MKTKMHLNNRKPKMIKMLTNQLSTFNGGNTEECSNIHISSENACGELVSRKDEAAVADEKAVAVQLPQQLPLEHARSKSLISQSVEKNSNFLTAEAAILKGGSAFNFEKTPMATYAANVVTTGVNTKLNLQIPSDILDDLASRFIINVPDVELNNLIRICFQIELAHWFYLDFFCSAEQNLKLPTISIKPFAVQIFQHIPFLRHHLPTIDHIFEDWKSYKLSVPTYGAILVSEDLKYCLLVQSYFAKSSWGFPKGKVNENEDPVHCATREVYEETGYDITEMIKTQDFVEAIVNFQYTRLYIVLNVSMKTQFTPRTRNEIKCCDWFPIDLLPVSKNDAISKNKLGINANSFFMIMPFIRRLKKWVSEQRSNISSKKSNGAVELDAINGINVIKTLSLKNLSSDFTQTSRNYTPGYTSIFNYDLKNDEAFANDIDNVNAGIAQLWQDQQQGEETSEAQTKSYLIKPAQSDYKKIRKRRRQRKHTSSGDQETDQNVKQSKESVDAQTQANAADSAQCEENKRSPQRKISSADDDTVFAALNNLSSCVLANNTENGEIVGGSRRQEEFLPKMTESVYNGVQDTIIRERLILKFQQRRNPETAIGVPSIPIPTIHNSKLSNEWNEQCLNTFKFNGYSINSRRARARAKANNSCNDKCVNLLNGNNNHNKDENARNSISRRARKRIGSRHKILNDLHKKGYNTDGNIEYEAFKKIGQKLEINNDPIETFNYQQVLSVQLKLEKENFKFTGFQNDYSNSLSIINDSNKRPTYSIFSSQNNLNPLKCTSAEAISKELKFGNLRILKRPSGQLSVKGSQLSVTTKQQTLEQQQQLLTKRIASPHLLNGNVIQSDSCNLQMQSEKTNKLKEKKQYKDSTLYKMKLESREHAIETEFPSSNTEFGQLEQNPKFIPSSSSWTSFAFSKNIISNLFC